jgi:hypothetical protein
MSAAGGRRHRAPKGLNIALEICLVVLPRQPIHIRRGVLLKFEERLFEQVGHCRHGARLYP